MNNSNESFPLESRDRTGNDIKVGDKVKIVEIPDWLVHDLPEVEASAIRKCVGTEMVVYEIDKYGYLWVKLINIDNEEEYQAQSFAMELKNLLKIY